MHNPARYFEIPVADLERAIAFYGAVFGYEVERTTLDGNAMALFPLDPAAPGITGALAQGDSYIPGRQGVRLYLHSDDIDETLRRVDIAGGKLVYPKTAVGDYGTVAEFEDSEGNVIAIHAD